MIIIGNKNTFAFQYEVESEAPILMLKSCFWVQGKFIGNHEDSGALAAVTNGLRRLISYNGNFYEEEFLNKRPEEVMLTMIPNLHQPEKKFRDYPEEVQNELVRYDKYMDGFGENYDYFILRIYAINGMYHFLWELQPEPWMESEFKCFQGYDPSIQSGTVSLSDLKYVYNELMKNFPGN